MKFLIDLSRVICFVGLLFSGIMFLSGGFGTADTYYQPIYDIVPEMFHDDVAEATGDIHKKWVMTFFGASGIAFLVLLINLSIIRMGIKDKDVSN